MKASASRQSGERFLLKEKLFKQSCDLTALTGNSYDSGATPTYPTGWRVTTHTKYFSVNSQDRRSVSQRAKRKKKKDLMNDELEMIKKANQVCKLNI